MIIRLAHVEVGVTDIGRAREFYVDVLGFTEHGSTAEQLLLRGAAEFDQWSLKLFRAAGPGLRSIGFRVADPDDLGRLVEVHEDRGLRCAALPAGVHHPGRGRGVRVEAPGGFAVDFHHAVDELDPYTADGRVLAPARRRQRGAGIPPTALDHVNLRSAAFHDTVGYLRDTLGFSVAEEGLDTHGDPYAVWMRRTRSSHDVAVLAHATSGMHHFAYLVPDGAALIRASDLLSDAGFGRRIQCPLSRHGVTDALTMYVLDPDGNRVELYTGDYRRDLDRPALRWRADDFEADGRFRWGGTTDPAFRDIVPILAADWPAPAMSASSTPGGPR